MSLIPLLRLAALGSTLLFSIVILGLSAYLTNISVNGLGAAYQFEALALATSLITVVSLPVLIVVGLTRKGAFTSMIWVELTWLAIVSVLWLATAALTSSNSSYFYPDGCNFFRSTAANICHDFFGVEGISWLIWLILLGWIVLLLILSIISGARGNKVWTASVADANFFSHPAPASSELGIDEPAKGDVYAQQHQQQQQQQQQPAVYQYPPNDMSIQEQGGYPAQKQQPVYMQPAVQHSPYPQV